MRVSMVLVHSPWFWLGKVAEDDGIRPVVIDPDEMMVGLRFWVSRVLTPAPTGASEITSVSSSSANNPCTITH